MMDEIKKLKLRNYGILVGVLIVMILIMVLMSLLSRNSWNLGLEDALDEKLEQVSPGTYQIQQNYPLRTGFGTSAIAFELSQTNKKNASYAVVIRIATLYGPYPAVFICEADSTVDFIGFLNVQPAFEKHLTALSINSSISSWKKRVPSLLSLQEGINEK